MAIDFLGRQAPKKSAKTQAKVIYHQPDKEKIPVKVSAPPKKVEAPKPKPTAPKEELGEVNLITAFKAYLLKKRIIIVLISIVVILVIGSVAIYLLTLPPKIVLNTNLNQPINQPPPAPVCGNSQLETGEECDNSGCGPDQECLDCLCQQIILPAPVCGNGIIETDEDCDQSGCGAEKACVNCLCQQIIPPAPVCNNGVIETGEQCDLTGCPVNYGCNNNCQCEQIVFPDTELSTLRGALVRFSSSADIFLVEWNGELRLVDQPSVVFKDGSTIKDLGSRIYEININFKDTRQGKDVLGYIDWDPRALSAEDLQNFN